MTGDVVEESRRTVAAAYRGTYRPPDATPRPAAKGRKLAIISQGQTSPSSAIPTAGAAEAARALGWEVRVLDMQLDPAKAPGLVQEAVAAGVDGIVVNFDCMLAQPELAAAKRQNIRLAPLYAFDCDDQSYGAGAKPPVFTTLIEYGVGRIDNARYTGGHGALTASAVIAATGGTAKVLVFTDPRSTILNYVHAGFLQQMQRCTGCAVLETVQFSVAELGAPLEAKVAAALARHPDATVVRSPLSAATLLGIAPALVKAGRQHSVMVIGGEGFDQDLDLIRTRRGLTATFLVDSRWTGWAVVDALNSDFVGGVPRPAGFGIMLVDRDHNLPPSGPARHNVDFRGIYRKAWGVGT